ncbi:calmodulin-binding protein 60 C-like [Chenopodium quinoa]|uniref:calmodulin-binding protein 60 C-like n=1 Tax=Chenopodium quinoa TaxID=63459 RepID=UPI000B7808A5|nr:calmodulin-binding protein 60 C-like [Chenopodium quinoa]
MEEGNLRRISPLMFDMFLNVFEVPNHGSLYCNWVYPMIPDVREKVEHTIQRSPLTISRSLPNPVDPSESIPFKLQFEHKLPCKLFTGNKVEAEGSSSIKVLLLDAVSGHLITGGPLSSKRVEIVVIQGHFKAEQLENWTKSDFCKHIVSRRSNKGSLLVGQCEIVLHNGIGFVNDICFTDNSSWVRSKKFRLGARVVAEEDRVMEAVSNAFQVKDRRGETYKKHDIPSLDDEVWRLCWIAKDGKISKMLEENQIYTVKDFISLYHTDESFLRGIVKVSPKKWNEIIQRANSCFTGYDACTNLNNSAQINIPIAIGSTINPNTVPCSSLQQFCVNDQQMIQMPESNAGEYSHQLGDNSMGLDNSLLENLCIGSPKDVCLPPLCYNMPPPPSTMLDGQASSWHSDQLLREEGIGMLSSIPGVSADAADIANPEAGLEDIG